MNASLTLPVSIDILTVDMIRTLSGYMGSASSSGYQSTMITKYAGEGYKDGGGEITTSQSYTVDCWVTFELRRVNGQIALSPTVTFCKGQAARRNHFICPLESQKLDKKRCVTAEEIKRRMNMNDKFCTYCGTPLEENAKFCVGCGSKTDAAPVYAGADAPAPGAPQQTGAYYQMQQEPAPPQAGGYYQQPTAAPGPGGGPYYPPQQPGAGYPNAGYPYAGIQRRCAQRGTGVLIGVIIGLAVLAAAVIFLFS